MSHHTHPSDFKRVRRFEQPRRPRMLTFSCYEGRELIADDTRAGVIAESIGRAALRHRWVLVAWVLMPNHVHIVAVPWGGAGSASELLRAIKRPASHRIKRILESGGDPMLETLTVQERPGKRAFRFWQEGGGFDHNIRSCDGVEQAIRYVHENPVGRGLCERPEDWKWSSAAQLLGRDVDDRAPRVARFSDSAGLGWEGPDAWFGGEAAAR